MDEALTMWIGVGVISLVGTLAHFLYDISGKNRVIGLFTAVNESTWEHIKIAITPSLLWGLMDGYLYGENPNYFCAKLMSLLTLTLVIPILFYSYRKISQKSILFVDISIFYIAIILSQFAFYAILNLTPMWHIFSYLSCIGLFMFFGCYMTLTLAPLKNSLFKDPINGRYGFRAHINPFKKHKDRDKSPKS